MKAREKARVVRMKLKKSLSTSSQILRLGQDRWYSLSSWRPAFTEWPAMGEVHSLARQSQ